MCRLTPQRTNMSDRDADQANRSPVFLNFGDEWLVFFRSLVEFVESGWVGVRSVGYAPGIDDVKGDSLVEFAKSCGCLCW